MKNEKKRVMFTFDQRSFDGLQKMKEEGGFSSMAETVRRSLQVNRAIKEQIAKMHLLVFVRNRPHTYSTRRPLG